MTIIHKPSTNKCVLTHTHSPTNSHSHSLTHLFYLVPLHRHLPPSLTRGLQRLLLRVDLGGGRVVVKGEGEGEEEREGDGESDSESDRLGEGEWRLSDECQL